MADCFLIPIEGVFVIVKVYQYQVQLFIPVSFCFEVLNPSVPWCLAEDLVRLDHHAPCSLSAFG